MFTFVIGISFSLRVPGVTTLLPTHKYTCRQLDGHIGKRRGKIHNTCKTRMSHDLQTGTIQLLL